MTKVRRALVASVATALSGACMPEPLAARWAGEGVLPGTRAQPGAETVLDLRLEPVSSDDSTARYDAELRFDTPDGPQGARGWLEEDLELAAVTVWLSREPALGGLAQCADHGEWPMAEGDVGFRGGVSDDRQEMTLSNVAMGPCFAPNATYTAEP